MSNDRHARTQAIHAGTRRSQYGEVSEAIYLTQGFVYDTAEAAAARFLETGPDEFIYARYGNPTVAMFEERPVFGWGAGTYQFEYARFQRSDLRTAISTNNADLGNAHSEYLGPLAEQGLLGLAGVLALLFIIFLKKKIIRVLLNLQKIWHIDKLWNFSKTFSNVMFKCK